MPLRSRFQGIGPAAAAYLLFVCSFVAWVCIASVRDHYTFPNSDDWRIWDGYFSLPFARWVWEGGVGHRLVPTFALMAIDYETFGGHMHLPSLAALLCTVAALPVLWVGVRDCDELVPRTRAVLLGFSAYCVFWGGRLYNLHWGTNQGSVLVTLLLTVSLVCVDRYALRVRSGGGSGAAGLAVAAGASAFAATFSQGIGFAVWASLLAICVLDRLPIRVFAALIVASAGSVGLYLFGLPVPDGVSFDTAGSLLASRIPEVAAFSAAFVGGALGWVANGAGLIDEPSIFRVSFAVGGLGIAGSGAYALLLARPGRRLGSADRLAVGLLVFPLVGSLAAGLTRIAFFSSAEAVRPRFLCWSILFWLGLAFAAAASLGRRRGRWLELALPLASLAMLAGLIPTEHLHAGRRAYLNRMALAVLLGDTRSAAPGPFSPQRWIERVAPRFEREGRSLFDDPRSGLAGKQLLERFAATRGERCRGDFARLPRRPARGLADLEGRVWATDSGGLPGSVVLTDASGRVVGLANVVGSSLEPFDLFQHSREGAARWIGLVSSVRPTEPLTAWGLLEDGSVCPFARATVASTR